MLRSFTALLALILFGSVESAQAQQRAYPSLSRRPVESRDRDAEIAKAEAERPVLAPVDAGTLAELGRLGGQASRAGAQFDTALPAATRAVSAAGGAATGSEGWVVAQQALSNLDASRFDCVTALAAIDTIYVEQLNQGRDASPVESYRTPVATMVDRQNDRLDLLRARLARP